MIERIAPRMVLWNDLRYSLRLLRKRPGFTAVAVITLAIGIGANAALFSVVNAVLLQPLSYPDADRLVVFLTTSPVGSILATSEMKFNAWRRESDVFQDVSAYTFDVSNFRKGISSEQVQTAAVTGDYFTLFGLRIARGRYFSADEERGGTNQVAILSDGFWKSVLGGDPRVLGSSITLNGKLYEIIGVLAPAAQTDPPQPIQAPRLPVEIWIPLIINPDSNQQVYYFSAAARLAPGITVKIATERLELVTEDLRRRFPNAVGLGPRNRSTIEPVRDAFVGKDLRLSLLTLLGAVAFILAIACANIASLLLVQASIRKRELTIRSVVGATRGRIFRQLVTESLVLSTAGGVFGYILGSIGVHALLIANSANLPLIRPDAPNIALDWRVLTFTALVSLTAGILFSLVPGLQVSRANFGIALKEDDLHAGTSFRQNRTRSILVATEVALALSLLVGAGLLIRTFIALRSVNSGIEPRNVLTMYMSLSDPQIQTASALAAFGQNGVAQLNSLPGVITSAYSSNLPLQTRNSFPFTIVGRPVEGRFHGTGHVLYISSEYFNVLRIPVTRGRAFTVRDQSGSPDVVIVNEAMAREFWPNGDPLNDRIVIARGISRDLDDPVRQIVGVVGDVHYDSLNRVPLPTMYVPESQLSDFRAAALASSGSIVWLIRTRVEPLSISSEIQNGLRQACGLPVGNVRPMTQIMSQSIARQNFDMWLLILFAGTATVLAAIGIYGLIGYSIQQRTKELGIRLALGAQTSDLMRMVMLEGLGLAAIGIIVGLSLSYSLKGIITVFLFGVTALDPITFAGVPLILAIVAFFSIWIPTRRIMRINLQKALRYE